MIVPSEAQHSSQKNFTFQFVTSNTEIKISNIQLWSHTKAGGLWSCWQKVVLAGCGGFTLAGCQTPTQTLSLPLLSRVGGENEIKKLMGWERKPKAVQGSKTKREIYSLLPISRHFLRSRASVPIAIAWEHKHHNHDVSSFFPFSLLLSLAETSCSMVYSFGHFSLPASCPLLGWSFLGWEDWRDSLDAAQSLLSRSENTGVSSVLF